MKNKLLALLASIGLVASASALEINENLSINGFIDGSFKANDGDGPNASNGQEIGLDEIELNFLFNHGPVSGAIHIDDFDGSEDGTPFNGGGDSGNAEIDIEQAHVTYSLDNGVSFTLGRYGSALGFEREDPAGLYTFSRAYSDSRFNLGDVDSNVVEGLAVSYAGDNFGLAVSFEEGIDQDITNSDLDLEIAVTYTGLENVTIGIGYFFDNEEGDNTEEVDVLNAHVSTTFGKLFLAAEYTELQFNNIENTAIDRDFDGYLVLADYDFNDKLGAALRVSDNEIIGPVANGNVSRIALAPNYAITDNLGAIVELSDVDYDGDDGNEFAIELTYTF